MAVTMAAATFIHATALAGEPSQAAADKSGYTLFTPVPRAQMREMNTDRPDITESPYTVDAGHFQFELSLVDYAHNKDNGVRTDDWSVLPSNIKVGLLNNLDIQFVFTPYERVQEKADGVKRTADGLGDDTQIRLKINLWGNDGGATAFALMPFVKFPTGSDELSNDHVEGGLILPLAISLPQDFSLGLMAEIDVAYNDVNRGYGVDFVHSATLSHPILGKLDAYIEYVGVAPHDTGHTYQAIASTGLTYALTDNWMLDCGGTIGLSDSADDFTLFVGTSFRY